MGDAATNVLTKHDDISDFEDETSSDLQLDSSKVDEVDEYKQKVIEYWKSGKKK